MEVNEQLTEIQPVPTEPTIEPTPLEPVPLRPTPIIDAAERILSQPDAGQHALARLVVEHVVQTYEDATLLCKDNSRQVSELVLQDALSVTPEGKLMEDGLYQLVKETCTNGFTFVHARRRKP